MTKKCFILTMLLFMFVTSCGANQDNPPCEYERLDNCQMAKYFMEDQKDSAVTASIKNQSIKITNQSLKASDLLFRLDEYYYSKVTGAIAYKVIIERLDEKPIESKQVDNLVRMKEEGDLYLSNNRDEKNLNEDMQIEGKKIVWYSTFLLDAISPKDSVKTYKIKERLDSVSFYYDGNKIGEYQLPEYSCQENIAHFAVSENDRILEGILSEEGISIVWDIRDVLEKFHEMLKNLPEGEDPESYGYSIYSTILLNKKNGDKINLDDCTNTFDTIEENEISSFNAVFPYSINLNEVDSIEIDGVKYKIRRDIP